MPGLGRKTFVATEVLTAANVNGYLMDQSVMRFATSAARSSAIGTAVSEGMVAYLDSTDSLELYNGSAWVPVSTADSGNTIINGAFEINQRNFTSTTTSGAFGFDRWALEASGGTATYSSQAFTPGTAPVVGYEAKNFARLVTVSQTGTSAYALLSQKIEDVRTFAAQTATVSFWAKASAGTPKIGVAYTQNFDGSAQVNGNISDVTISTAWTRYSRTVSIPSVSGKTIGNASNLRLMMFTSAGSDLAAWTSIGIQNETIDIWGVQLESGSTATAFKRNATNIQGELAACQRYYQQFQLGERTISMSGNDASMTIPLLNTMRSAPSFSIGMTNANYGNSGAGWTFTKMGVTSYTKSGTVTVGVNGDALHAAVWFINASYSGVPNGIQDLGTGNIIASAEL